MELHMLSTTDNPYNPFHRFDEWMKWDMEKGYHTSAYLARIIKTSDDLSEADADLALELAIDEIVEENVLGLYIRVTENDVAPRPTPAQP